MELLGLRTGFVQLNRAHAKVEIFAVCSVLYHFHFDLHSVHDSSIDHRQSNNRLSKMTIQSALLPSFLRAGSYFYVVASGRTDDDENCCNKAS